MEGFPFAVKLQGTWNNVSMIGRRPLQQGLFLSAWLGGRLAEGWTRLDKKLCMCAQELCIIPPDLEVITVLCIHGMIHVIIATAFVLYLCMQQCLVITLYLVLTVAEYIVCVCVFVLMLNCEEKRANKTSSWRCIFGVSLGCSLCFVCVCVCIIYISSAWLMEWKRRSIIWLIIKRLLNLFYRSIHQKMGHPCWMLHILVCSAVYNPSSLH